MSETLEASSVLDFDSLYRTYQARVYRQCFRILRNQADAEDLTQEVFLRVLQKADTFRGESRFSTWLHRVTINIALMQLRRERRRPVRTASLTGPFRTWNDNADVLEVANIPAPPSVPLFDQVSLRTAMEQLSTGYRDVFVLHDVEGYEHEEVGRLLGISEGTSKSQLHKARKRLRVLLHQEGEKSALASISPGPRPMPKNRHFVSCGVHVAAA